MQHLSTDPRLSPPSSASSIGLQSPTWSRLGSDGHSRRDGRGSTTRSRQTVWSLLWENPLPEVVNRLHRRVQNESPRGMPNEIAYGIAFATAGAIATTIARRRLRSRRVAGDLPASPARLP